MKTLELLRTKLYANEIADIMPSFIIKEVIKYAHKAKILAEEIRDNYLYDDYNLTPEQIDSDIKAFNYNLKVLRRALTIRNKQPFQEFMNGAIVGLN